MSTYKFSSRWPLGLLKPSESFDRTDKASRGYGRCAGDRVQERSMLEQRQDCLSGCMTEVNNLQNGRGCNRCPRAATISVFERLLAWKLPE